jgi:large conductance mechanosensitive channel
LQAVINFLIVAFVLFLIIRFINRITPKKPEDVPEAAKSPEVMVLEEIRDALKKPEPST